MRPSFRICLVALASRGLFAETAKPAAKINLIVNGGYNETSYHERHRKAVNFFYDNVFHRRATVLDGGGPDGLYVLDDAYGNSLRGEDGWVKLARSTYPFPTTPGTLSSIDDTFTDLAKMGLTHVSAVYGDHGGKDGVALWGGKDRLSALGLKRQADKLPPETIVQSLHLHCYGGAVLADPSRVRPQSVLDWPEYLRKNYRPNSCGLSMSQYDEVSYSQDFNKGNWPTRFKKPKLTLTQMKADMMEESELWTTPLLTSDVLTTDLTEFFCRNIQAEQLALGKRRGPKNTHSGAGATAAAARSSSLTLEDEVCRSNEHRDQVEDVVAEFEAIDKESNEVSRALRKHLREYVKAKYPTDWTKYVASQGKIDEVWANFCAYGKPKAERKAVEAAIHKIRTEEMLKIDVIWDTFDDSAELRAYVASKGGSSLYTRRDEIRPRYYAAQKKRKLLEGRWDEVKRKYIESEIKSSLAPEMMEVYKTYVAIKKCENTVFN